MTYGTDLAYSDPMRGAESTFSNQNPSENQSGLTKREYFAGLALQGLLAKHGCDLSGDDVQEAVYYATRLIEELNKN